MIEAEIPIFSLDSNSFENRNLNGKKKKNMLKSKIKLLVVFCCACCVFFYLWERSLFCSWKNLVQITIALEQLIFQTDGKSSYWGANANTVSGVKYFVGYDGTSDPRTYGAVRAQTNLTTVLTQRCKGVDTSAKSFVTVLVVMQPNWLSNLGGTVSAKVSKSLV